MDEKKLFTKTDGVISSLIDDIKNGDLTLPELQRPFVWGNNRARDLFNSMFQEASFTQIHKSPLQIHK